jgi:hypothetical protein
MSMDENCHRCGKPATGYVEDGPVCEGHYKSLKGKKWRPGESDQDQLRKALVARPSYREAVAWVALNDNPGGDDASDVESIKSYLTVAMGADLFGITPERFAASVVAYREEEVAKEAMKKK